MTGLTHAQLMAAMAQQQAALQQQQAYTAMLGNQLGGQQHGLHWQSAASAYGGSPYSPYYGTAAFPAVSTATNPFAIANALGNPLAQARAEPPKPAKPLERAGITVGELIGWRAWRVQNGHLWSVTYNTAWAPGEAMEGKPDDYGSAGIYAFKKLRKLITEFGSQDLIYGQVAMWGEVVEHDDGYRAEYAKIISLDGAFGSVSKRTVAEMATKYGLTTPQKSAIEELAPELRLEQPAQHAPPPRSASLLVAVIGAGFMLIGIAASIIRLTIS